MSDKQDGKSFWTTLPGILTGSAALLTAIGGLITALYAAGLLQQAFATPTVAPPTDTPTSTRGFAIPTVAPLTTKPTSTYPTPPLCIVNENFNSLPDWDSTWDSTWGKPANWTGSGTLSASLAVPGSSAKVKVYPISHNSSYTIQVFMNGAASPADYWTEAAYKLGRYSAQDFDENGSTWVLINKFDRSGSHANGNNASWAPYAALVDTGGSTSISIGYKAGMQLGSSGYPGGNWRNLTICQR